MRKRSYAKQFSVIELLHGGLAGDIEYLLLLDKVKAGKRLGIPETTQTPHEEAELVELLKSMALHLLALGCPLLWAHFLSLRQEGIVLLLEHVDRNEARVFHLQVESQGIQQSPFCFEHPLLYSQEYLLQPNLSDGSEAIIFAILDIVRFASTQETHGLKGAESLEHQELENAPFPAMRYDKMNVLVI